MIKLSHPKITGIKVDYYEKGYKHTAKYSNTIYLLESDYKDRNILKCEIKFRYKFRRHIHILTGDITVKDIFNELLNILKEENTNERHSI